MHIFIPKYHILHFFQPHKSKSTQMLRPQKGNLGVQFDNTFFNFGLCTLLSLIKSTLTNTKMSIRLIYRCVLTTKCNTTIVYIRVYRILVAEPINNISNLTTFLLVKYLYTAYKTLYTIHYIKPISNRKRNIYAFLIIILNMLLKTLGKPPILITTPENKGTVLKNYPYS